METRIFDDFEIMDGKEKIMFSAPHGYIHMRDGQIKYAETNTDALAKELAEEFKAYAIYKFVSSDNDANWDVDCDYKKECLKTIKRAKIKLLIDFHGMAQEREEDICIGINGGELIDHDEKFLEFIVESFKKAGFENVSVDSPFNASRKEVVSNYMHSNAGIKCFQVEINGKYRLPESEKFRLAAVKNAVRDIVKYFNNNK